MEGVFSCQNRHVSRETGRKDKIQSGGHGEELRKEETESTTEAQRHREQAGKSQRLVQAQAWIERIDFSGQWPTKGKDPPGQNRAEWGTRRGRETDV